ncbi:chloroplast protein FOR GROWTH AND FERTILITY 2-like [Phragmites australis]|uniref:chloroplast protein FOR GROWTH AND FERTILITY 2-like n=1 Tax=Phragmites australis TaxID=29695 RepID=UPI002D78CDC5|nr:chloroplast protein FOR GROWTH AND FERTILITY 2-like [Phragmites australis]
MERLISSSPLLRRAPVAAASRPRASRPPFVAATLCGGVRGTGLAFMQPLSQHRPQAPVPAASGSPSPTAEGEADVSSAAKRRFFQKVTSAAAVTLLSAITLTLIQPAMAPPAALAHFHPTAKAGTTLFKSELLGSAWTGFLAGCLHTLSGPDHLAALAPLSIGRTRMESAFVGALWGCGHDAGQVIFGLLFLSLKDRLHIEVIRTWSTRVVALTLLIIGALGIREATEVPTPCVALENGECDASMMDHHHHPVEALPSGKKTINFATFATGIVHGLQPDALVMVLPALALPSRVAGAAFLGMFLVGTVVSMGSYTVLIGSCTEALKERVPRITEKLTWAASLVAISMGLAILISQSFGFTLY